MTVRQRTHAGSAVAPEFTTHGAPAAVWLNGRRQAAEGAHLSGRDRGLTLADGAFETMRAHNLTVFRLDRHLERLRHALGALEIPAPTELRSGVLDAVQSGRWERRERPSHGYSRHRQRRCGPMCRDGPDRAGRRSSSAGVPEDGLRCPGSPRTSRRDAVTNTR